MYISSTDTTYNSHTCFKMHNNQPIMADTAVDIVVGQACAGCQACAFHIDKYSTPALEMHSAEVLELQCPKSVPVL